MTYGVVNNNVRAARGGIGYMLLKFFAATGAAATALKLAIGGVKGGVFKVTFAALLRFIEYFLITGVGYLGLLYLITELTIKLEEPQDEPSAFWKWQFGEIAEMVRSVFRVKIEINGLELLPEDGRYLMVSNHRSLFDPVTMAAAFKNQEYVYISKPSNFKIPIAGKVMHKCGCLALNREDNREALVTIKRAAEIIGNDSASVVIYPEGTRSQKDELLPFHAGSFKIAQKANVPVVAVAMRNTDKVVHRGPIRKTTVYIDVVGVIDSDYVKTHNTKETAQLAQSMIQERLDIEKTK